MNLFKYEGDILTISPEAYALVPFRVIWNRDRSKGKRTCVAELSYVYFMADYKSDFSDILDPDERSVEIIKVLDLKSGWKPDDKVKNAIQLYLDRRDGIGMRMLESSKILASKVEKFCRSVDLDERDPRSGKPIHNLKQINDVLKDMSKILDSMSGLEDKVKKEISENKDMIGSKSKNMFEDGIM